MRAVPHSPFLRVVPSGAALSGDVADCDVLILGAGAAGAALAAALAPACRVVLVDRRRGCPQPALAVLSPETHGLLTGRINLDPLPAVFADCRSAASRWLVDPGRLTALLRRQAAGRGATVLTGMRPSGLRRAGRSVSVVLQGRHGHRTVSARLAVDATGRAAWLAKRCGARPLRRGRLVACDVTGVDAASHGAATGRVIRMPDTHGWWETICLPMEGCVRRQVTWFAEAGPATAEACPEAFLRRAPAGLRALLAASGFRATGPVSPVPAFAATLDRAAGPDWCAVGDAVLCDDAAGPAGRMVSLDTAFLAAEACLAALQTGRFDAAAYAAAIRQRAAAGPGRAPSGLRGPAIGVTSETPPRLSVVPA